MIDAGVRRVVYSLAYMALFEESRRVGVGRDDSMCRRGWLWAGNFKPRVLFLWLEVCSVLYTSPA